MLWSVLHVQWLHVWRLNSGYYLEYSHILCIWCIYNALYSQEVLQEFSNYFIYLLYSTWVILMIWNDTFKESVNCSYTSRLLMQTWIKMRHTRTQAAPVLWQLLGWLALIWLTTFPWHAMLHSWAAALPPRPSLLHSIDSNHMSAISSAVFFCHAITWYFLPLHASHCLTAVYASSNAELNLTALVILFIFDDHVSLFHFTFQAHFLLHSEHSH